jgi:uncharacterized protein (UPF0333 family)
MKDEKRGQISVEYLIVIGFVIFLVIGILSFAFYYTAGTDDAIRINQLNNFANKIITNAESVSYAGEPSKVTITAFLPKGVSRAIITENSLVFDISTSSGMATMGFQADVSIADNTLSINEGLKVIKISAGETEVTIDDTPG